MFKKFINKVHKGQVGAFTAMGNQLELMLGSILVFVVGTKIIDSQVTGTDDGSVLVISLGALMLAINVIYALLPKGMLGR